MVVERSPSGGEGARLLSVFQETPVWLIRATASIHCGRVTTDHEHGSIVRWQSRAGVASG